MDLTTVERLDEISAVKVNVNPFPGLRPFGIEESHLFFGREGQSEEVLGKLSDNKFVAVIGASGTGKSSLIYCGLVPILYGGFIASAGSKWRIITSRPGSSPIDNIADSIVKSVYLQEPEEEKNLKRNFYSAILRSSSLGLVEALKNIPSVGEENILLLVDQFEELFRYRISRKGMESVNESGAFVKLLIEAINQSEIPIYIVLTMRSDFIGECSNFQELTALINRSNYLIPQMTRNDFRDAIHGPVAVGGATIDTALVQELLNDVGDNPDQLPILQHAMMRTWEYWLQNSDKDKPVGISEYEAIGKMERALSEHANEAYDELSENGKRICEFLFKTITEKGADNRGVRRPTRLDDIAEIAHATIEEVIEVIDKFRKSGRSFLTPSHEVTLHAGSIIDLSHESLMRIWNRLKVWVEEESNAVQMYMRLSEAASLFQQGKTGLWRPPDLQIALNWELKQQPTLAWAQRHNPAFERTMVFLHTSAKEYEAAELNKIKLQKRALQRSRIIAIVLGTASIISLFMYFWAQSQRVEAEKQRKDATKQSMKASILGKFSKESAEKARLEQKNAEKQKEIALRQQEIAEEQKNIAKKNEDLAKQQTELAKKRSKEAEVERTKAEKSADEAKAEKAKADTARERATNLRMLSISQSMAVKSQQTSDDIDLKSLLAYQAFKFNEKYQGAPNSPDIYSGLYLSLLAQNGRSFNVFKGHTGAVNSVIFWPSASSFYTAGSDGKIIRWDLADSAHKPVVIINNKLVNKSIDISADGQWLAIGTYGSGLGLYDLKNPQSEVRYFPNLGRSIEAVAFAPDGKTIIAVSDTNLLEFNITNGAGIVTGSVDGYIFSLDISADGKTVATGTKNGKIYLWDRSLGYKKQLIFSENTNQIRALAFNHKGDQLASGGKQGYLKIWDVKEKKMLSNIKGHFAPITCIRYSPDDKTIATASWDKTACLWNADNLNEQPVKLKDHEYWVLSLAFSPFGDKLVTGSSDEERLILWPTRTYAIAEQVTKKIGRNFTKDEWDTYVGKDIPYETTK